MWYLTTGRRHVLCHCLRVKKTKDSASYRGIGLLNKRKFFGRVLIEKVIQKTEFQKENKQGGFRREQGCADQMFGLKEMCEKYLGNGLGESI